MECICVICEEIPQADLLQDLADYTTIFYNLTSFEISEWKDIHLLKICEACKEKLLQYDVFRKLCITVCTKLRQRSNTLFPSVAPSFVNLEYNGGDDENTAPDYELPNETNAHMECKLESPAGRLDAIEEHIAKDDASVNADNGVSGEYKDDFPENDKEGINNIPPGCHLCGKIFRNQHNLEGHIRVHQGLKPALCKLCGKAFIRWHSLKLHMIQKHTERRSDLPKTPFPCDFGSCEASFATKQGMLRHRKRHDPEYTKPVANTFVCELCGKTFSSKGSLQKHSYIHTGNMPFHCTVCDKRYPTAHKLKEHTMRHQGIKNHTCPQCGLKKTTMHELRVHMNYHTKEKKFPCNFCTKVFMNTGNLATHVKTVHQKLTPFNCTHCNRSFGKKESLKRHIMTHTGERPHECTTCGKRFIQLVALQSHAKVHKNLGKS